MQAVLTANLSRLYCVLGDFHMSAETLLQTFLLVSDFYPHNDINYPMK